MKYRKLAEFIDKNNEIFGFNISNIDLSLIDDSTSIYDFFIDLIKKNNIKFPISRTKAFFGRYGLNLTKLEKYDHSILLLEGEKKLNIFPLGQQWEDKIYKEKDFRDFIQQKLVEHAADQNNLQLSLEKNKEINKIQFPFVKKTFVYKFGAKSAEDVTKMLNMPEHYNKTFDDFVEIKKEFFGGNYSGDIPTYNLKSINNFLDLDNLSFNVDPDESFDYRAWAKFFASENINFKNKPKNLETEIRVRGVTGLEFANLFKYLLNSTEFINTNVYYTVERMGNIRRLIFDERSDKNFTRKDFYQEKSELDWYTNKTWNFKVSKSSERIIPTTNMHGKIEHKNRFNFYTHNRKHPFFNCEVALSVISNKYGEVRYDIEIEEKFGNISNPLKTIQFVYKVLQNTPSPIPISQKLFIKEQILMGDPRNLVSKVLPFTFTPKDIMEISKTELFATLKLDGDRMILLLHPKFGVYLITLDSTFIKLFDSHPTNTHSIDAKILIDCEVMRDGNIFHIHMFDLISDRFKNHLKPFSQRLEYIQKIYNTIKQDLRHENVRYYVKNFIQITDTKVLSKMIDDDLENDNTDGVIIQTNDDVYRQTKIFKLKPKALNTMDIYVEPYLLNSEENLHYNYSFVNKNMRRYLLNFEYNLSNFIMECYWNKNSQKFVPLKIRFDKTYGNPKRVIDSTSKLIYEDEMSYRDMFLGKSLFMARKHINNLKGKILTMNQNKILLDIGSGQGGDFDKWGHFDYVYAVEKDKKMIDEFVRRHGSSGRVNLIEGDFADLNISFDVDIITIFFAVNVIFKTKEYLEKFIKKLVSTNCKRIYVLFHDNDKLLAMDGDVVKIKQHFKEEKTFFGNDITINIEDTFINNVHEYLFYGYEFIKEMKKYNYRGLVYSPFSDKDKTINGVHMNAIKFNMSKYDENWLKSVRYIELNRIEDTADEDEFIMGNNEFAVIDAYDEDQHILDHNKKMNLRLAKLEDEDDHIGEIKQKKPPPSPIIGGLSERFTDNSEKISINVDGEQKSINIGSFIDAIYEDDDYTHINEIPEETCQTVIDINSDTDDLRDLDINSDFSKFKFRNSPKNMLRKINKELNSDLNSEALLLIYLFSVNSDFGAYKIHNIEFPLEEFTNITKAETEDEANMIYGKTENPKKMSLISILEKPSEQTLKYISKFNNINIYFPKYTDGCLVLCSERTDKSSIEKIKELKYNLIKHLSTINFDKFMQCITKYNKGVKRKFNKTAKVMFNIFETILTVSNMNKYYNISTILTKEILNISADLSPEELYIKIVKHFNIYPNLITTNTLLKTLSHRADYMVVFNKNNIHEEYSSHKADDLYDAVLKSLYEITEIRLDDVHVKGEVLKQLKKIYGDHKEIKYMEENNLYYLDSFSNLILKIISMVVGHPIIILYEMELELINGFTENKPNNTTPIVIKSLANDKYEYVKIKKSTMWANIVERLENGKKTSIEYSRLELLINLNYDDYKLNAIIYQKAGKYFVLFKILNKWFKIKDNEYIEQPSKFIFKDSIPYLLFYSV
uniref:Uncharacterized protein n=1 Tax=viral metagenome TaxID=1070528 RepID=A0A6C0J9Z4_9ZZZZ